MVRSPYAPNSSNSRSSLTLQTQRRGTLIETWRRLGMFLLLFSTAGIVLELYFLEHFEDKPQWIPIALLGVGLAVALVVAVRPNRKSVRALQTLMLGNIVAGGLGIYFHLRSNVEFELELHPSMEGMELVMESLRGAMPALAPGAMAQLGLLGLLVCFRHPALNAGTADIEVSRTLGDET